MIACAPVQENISKKSYILADLVLLYNLHRCFKCTSPKTDSCILLNGGGNPLTNRGFNELTSAIPTAVLLVQHIGRDTTELSVANAFRVYAPVKSVKIVDEPESYPKNQAAVVEFHTIESSSHVMTTASANQMKVGGELVELSFAKATAPHIALAWVAQAAATKSREMNDQRSMNRYKDDDRRYGGGNRGGGDGGHYGHGGGGHYGDSSDRHYERDRSRDRDRSHHHRDEKSRSRVVIPPKWPPSFEEDGAVWTFDPTSGYFVHRPTEMFYEPKSKWYSKRDEAGVFGYYYHAPGYDPPFILMPAASTTATTAATTATTTTGAPVVTATASSQPITEASNSNASATPQGVSSLEADKVTKEQKPKSHKNKVEVGTLRIAMKKSAFDINKWNERQNEDDNETNSDKASHSIQSSSSVVSKPAKEDENSLLMKLGLDYSTLGCLRVLPKEGEGQGGPLCEGSGDRWACLISRRCFPSEELLAKHIRLSKLYREELTKAVNENRIIRSLD